MQASETSCLVRLFGPIHWPSVWDAFAEMVMIAFRKSPADVCVEAGHSGNKNDNKFGIKS